MKGRFRNRRNLLRMGAALGAAACLRNGAALAADAAAATGTAASAAKGASHAALSIGLLRNPVSGLIAVTDQKGWFKAAGLDLTSVLFSGAGGPKVLQAMGGGAVGIGSVSVTAALLALAANAIPLRIVSISTDPAPVFALLAAPEIDSIPKLAGKRVATTAGTGLHYFLARALGKFGMRLADVEFLNLPVGDAQAAFLAKRVDAVVPSLTGRYYIQSLRKDTRQLFTYDDFAKPPGPTTRFDDYDVFVAPQAVVEGNGVALRTFLTAYHDKGVRYLRDAATQEAAIADVTRYVNAEQKSPTDESAMRQQLLKSRFFDVREARDILASDAFRAGLEDQVRFFVDTKQIPASIPVDATIARGLLAS